MGYGYRGKILHVDLSNRKIEVEEKDDTLPKRLFDPKPDGPESGKKIFAQGDFEKAIALLYEIIGCDPETGKPHRGKLMELGLEWVDELLD